MCSACMFKPGFVKRNLFGAFDLRKDEELVWARPELCFNNEIAKSLPYVFLICNSDYALIFRFACSSAQRSNLIAFSMRSSLRGRTAKRRSVPLKTSARNL